jgi:hypothetical protein
MRLHFLLGVVMASLASAGTLLYGTEDCLTTGCYGASDPTAGATLTGLAPDAVTLATNSFGHGFPFTPTVGDFLGTDQIYVGSVQTASHDGYSGAAQRLNGPDVLTLDYSLLVGSGQTISDLTLGLAADDFQFPAFGQPFTVTINGTVDAALTAQIESLNQTGPQVQFFTIGINPSLLAASNILTVAIEEGGDGGDGYAIDFATVGITTTRSGSTPEPSSLLLVLAGGLMVCGLLRRRGRDD